MTPQVHARGKVTLEELCEKSSLPNLFFLSSFLPCFLPSLAPIPAPISFSIHNLASLGLLYGNGETIYTSPKGNADRSGGVLATSILALSLVLISIALRFETRIWLVKRVGWDDWCIVFAGVSLLLREQSGSRLLKGPGLVISSAWA